MSLSKNQTVVIEAGALNEKLESVTLTEGKKLICRGLLPGELIFVLYKRQLKLKEENISKLFGQDIAVTPSPQYAYRNKAVLKRRSG